MKNLDYAEPILEPQLARASRTVSKSTSFVTPLLQSAAVLLSSATLLALPEIDETRVVVLGVKQVLFSSVLIACLVPPSSSSGEIAGDKKKVAPSLYSLLATRARLSLKLNS
jgi:hypothetical protein